MRFDSCKQPPERQRAGLLRDRRGVSALELALLGPLLALMILGAVDLGGAVQQGLLLRQAVRAGALYAVQWPNDTTGITNAITAALPSPYQDAAVSTSSSCACWSSSSGIVAQPSCTCTTGTLQTYVTLSASRPYSPFLLKEIANTSASDVVRTQ